MIPEEHYNYEKDGNKSYESTDSLKNICFKKVELIYIKGNNKKPKLAVSEDSNQSVGSY